MTLILWKIWGWLKMNWKWILFPVGLLMSLGGVLIAIRTREQVILPEYDSDHDQELIETIGEARVVKDMQLKELKRKHHLRLKKMSDEQRKELEELNDKSSEEIAKWFDNL